MTNATIQKDVDNKNSIQADADFDAMAAYLARHQDKDDTSASIRPDGTKVRPREPDETRDDEDDKGTTQTDPEDDVEIDPDDADDNTEEEDEKPSGKRLAADDDELLVTVDGTEVRVSVKDAKRLVGQEKSLTRKSQEVAQLRKEAEQNHQKYATGVAKLMEQAKKNWEPYASIDWVVAGQKLTPEEIVALRETQTKAWQEYKFFTEELDATMKHREKQYRDELNKQAVETVKQIRDEQSQYYIPNWSTETYEKVRDYAVDSGVEPEIVNSIVDPAAIKILWKAMRYDEAKKKATQKVAQASPTKTVKSKDGKAPETKTMRASKALEKLKQSGDLDDAMNAYLARMNE